MTDCTLNIPNTVHPKYLKHQTSEGIWMDTYSFKFRLLNISIPRVNGILSENVSSCILGVWMLFGAKALDLALLSLLMEATDLNIYWLVVSTHLKNISQNRNLPQIGLKIKNIWNHHPVYINLISSVTFPQNTSSLQTL